MGYPSPCIDVCKYKLKRHCIGCSMTKAQKDAWKGLTSDEEKRDFIDMLLKQQAMLGGKFKAWPLAYKRKCEKKGKPNPLEALAAE